MTIQFKKINSKAITPTKGSEQAAGHDLYACIEYPVIVDPHKTVMIGTGLAIAVPAGYAGFIFARSGLATKRGIRPANCVGVCDADYRGEYIVALHNDSDEVNTVHPGDRIAQLVIMPVTDVAFFESKILGDTDRGAGGFGSTGA